MWIISLLVMKGSVSDNTKIKIINKETPESFENHAIQRSEEDSEEKERKGYSQFNVVGAVNTSPDVLLRDVPSV